MDSRDGVHQDLIFDIGMSEGNDTDFYLRKGFRVLGVEADPAVYAKLTERFAEPLTTGRLSIIHKAAFSQAGQQITFFSNAEVQGHSRVMQNPREFANKRGNVVEVETIDWPSLVRQAGTPYFCKVDIETSEEKFLSSIIGARTIPEYMSAEVHTFEPIELLHKIGYEKFRLINQTILNTFPIPNPPLEGEYVQARWVHASGLFGKELPGKEWYSFDQIRSLYQAILDLRRHGTLLTGWFDCHAYRPS